MILLIRFYCLLRGLFPSRSFSLSHACTNSPSPFATQPLSRLGLGSNISISPCVFTSLCSSPKETRIQNRNFHLYESWGKSIKKIKHVEQFLSGSLKHVWARNEEQVRLVLDSTNQSCTSPWVHNNLWCQQSWIKHKKDTMLDQAYMRDTCLSCSETAYCDQQWVSLKSNKINICPTGWTICIFIYVYLCIYMYMLIIFFSSFLLPQSVTIAFHCLSINLSINERHCKQ